MSRDRSSGESTRGFMVSSKTMALPQKSDSSAPSRRTNSLAIRRLTVFSISGRATADAARRAAKGTRSACRQNLS
jgi:hypothetical protein